MHDQGLGAAARMTLNSSLRRLAVVCGLLALSSCASTAPPPNVAPTGPVAAAPDSEIELSAVIPFSELRAALAAKTAQPIPVKGVNPLVCQSVPYAEGGGVSLEERCVDAPYCDGKACGTRRQCVKLPKVVPPHVGLRPVCAAYDWSAVITAEGPPVVGRVADRLHIEQPVKIEGAGQVTGELSGLVPVRNTHFQAHLSPGVDLGFDIGPDWCPAVAVTTTQHWVTSAKVEVLPRTCRVIDLGPLGKHPFCTDPANLDLTGLANAKTADIQAQLQTAVGSALACDVVRTQLAAIWKTTAIALPDTAGQKAYLNLTPRSAQLAKVSVDDQGLRVTARLGVRTEVSPIPVASTPIALPSLTRLSDTGGGVDLNLRATAPYVVLKQAIGASIVGTSFSAPATGGAASAQVIDFDLYPTGRSLTVGVKLKARLPGRLIDDSGWVYLTAEPTLAPNGKRLQLSRLRLAIVSDDPKLKVLATVFSPPIILALNSRANFDLTETLNKASDQMVEALNAVKISGVSLSAGRPEITVKDVAADSDGVLADANIRLTLNATVTRAIAGP